MMLVVKNLLVDAGDKGRRFNPWVAKIPWRRAWQPTPVFWHGESHGEKSLEGHKESDMTEATAQHKETKDLYLENCKMLMKEIKEDIYR